MKTDKNTPPQREWILPLQHDGEWLALEASPSSPRSYLRVIGSDGIEVAYQPICLHSATAWTTLMRFVADGSAACPYVHAPEAELRHRALIQSGIVGLWAYDFETGCCLLENGNEVSADAMRSTYEQVSALMGHRPEMFEAPTQRTADLCLQLLQRAVDALVVARPLTEGRLHRRLIGLEGRYVRVEFSEGTPASGILGRTLEFPPKHRLHDDRGGRTIEPSARIVAVDITANHNPSTEEVA